MGPPKPRSKEQLDYLNRGADALDKKLAGRAPKDENGFDESMTPGAKQFRDSLSPRELAEGFVKALGEEQANRLANELIEEVGWPPGVPRDTPPSTVLVLILEQKFTRDRERQARSNGPSIGRFRPTEDDKLVSGAPDEDDAEFWRWYSKNRDLPFWYARLTWMFKSPDAKGYQIFAPVGIAASAVPGSASRDMVPKPTGPFPSEVIRPDRPRPPSQRRNKFVDLTDAKARKHILEGDENGGGHRPGTGKSGKSEFPKGWSDEKILDAVSDVATDPNVAWSKPDKRGYITGTKTIDGVDVKVVFDTKNGRIVTGYPTNVPRNP
jgi:hypothetical protein